MSVGSMAVIFAHSRARGTARSVLLAIANHDGDGGAWPGVKTLGWEANTSERSVQGHLQTLVDLGEISIELNAGGDHRTRNDQRPNRYTILVECPPECDGSSRHQLRNAQKSGVRIPAPRWNPDAAQDFAPRTGSHGVQENVARGAGSRVHEVREPAPEPPMNHPEPAAAGSGARLEDSDDTAVAALREHFAQRPALEAISFTMRAEQHAEVAELVRRLTTRRMVKAAEDTKVGPVRRATAFLDTWRGLRDHPVVDPTRAIGVAVGPACPDCLQPVVDCDALNAKLLPADRCTQGKDDHAMTDSPEAAT